MIIAFLGTQEILIIAAVILLLFGGRKIPELMRSLGKGINSFKQGMNEPVDSASDSKTEINEEAKK